MAIFNIHFLDAEGNPQKEKIQSPERDKAKETVLSQNPGATYVGMEKSTSGEWRLIDGKIAGGDGAESEVPVKTSAQTASPRETSAVQASGTMQELPGLSNFLYMLGLAVGVVSIILGGIWFADINELRNPPMSLYVATLAGPAFGVCVGALLLAGGKIIAQLDGIQKHLQKTRG